MEERVEAAADLTLGSKNVKIVQSAESWKREKSLEVIHCIYPGCVFRTRNYSSYTLHLQTHKKYGNLTHCCDKCKISTPTGRTQHQPYCRNEADDGAVTFPHANNNDESGFNHWSVPPFKATREQVKPKSLPGTGSTLRKREFQRLFREFLCSFKFGTNKHLQRHGDDESLIKGSSNRSTLNTNVRVQEKKQNLRVTQTRAGGGTEAKKIAEVQKALFENGKYHCDKCDYKSVDRHLLVSHLKVHSDERPFLCTFPGCPNLPQGVRTHERRIHPEWVRPTHPYSSCRSAEMSTHEPLFKPSSNRVQKNQAAAIPLTGEDKKFLPPSEIPTESILVCMLCNFTCLNQESALAHAEAHTLMKIE